MRCSKDDIDRVVQALKAGTGREPGFRLLFHCFYQPMKRFFRRKGFPPDLCADLIQETFFGIFKGIEGYRGESSFEGWMFRIATNVYRKSLRRGAAAKRSGEELPIGQQVQQVQIPAEDRPLETVLQQERRERLRQAISELPEQRKRCMIYWVYHELTYEEIARVMRISSGTVRAHLAQAREQLRGMVEKGEVRAG